jgi:hypothetical protein
MLGLNCKLHVKRVEAQKYICQSWLEMTSSGTIPSDSGILLGYYEIEIKIEFDWKWASITKFAPHYSNYYGNFSIVLGVHLILNSFLFTTYLATIFFYSDNRCYSLILMANYNGRTPLIQYGWVAFFFKKKIVAP